MPNQDAEVDDTEPVSDGEGLDALVEYLLDQRAFDFSGYKRASLSRRVERRMQAVGRDGYRAYIEYLQRHPDEIRHLFNTILINVTSFFRDEESWASLRTHVEALLAKKGPGASIRVWCAGCATGEEPFSVAMLFAELLGVEEATRRLKIYATDIDEDALAQARLATYSEKSMPGVPEAMQKKYFAHAGTKRVLSKDLRRVVIFGRHDLLQDAPISRVDLLLCRNTLMYFNRDAQGQILTRLRYALHPGGLLLLGRAELLLTRGELFTPVDLKQRLFSPTRRPDRQRERIDASAPAEREPKEYAVLRAAINAAPAAIVIVDTRGELTVVNTQAMALFSLGASDIGRRLDDMEISNRPAELRAALEQAQTERRAVHLRDVERFVRGEPAFFDVDVAPLLGERSVLVGTQLTFTDVSARARLQGEVRRVHAQIESAHEELQSTSEELETTNEELQSSIEELETTNDELQSTNEELEAMNEETQSTNAELQTTNDELEQSTAQLAVANAFIGSVLDSLKSGVAVLDVDLRVTTWNRQMHELWGVGFDEVVGKSVLDVDVGVPLEELREALTATIAGDGGREVVLSGVTRRGRPIDCRVIVSPLRSGPRGVILMFEEVSDERRAT